MAATFRTPNRRPGGPGDNINHGSPSLIPRAQQGTPTGTTSEVGTSMSGTSDSRKRQSKKDEVASPAGLSF